MTLLMKMINLKVKNNSYLFINLSLVLSNLIMSAGRMAAEDILTLYAEPVMLSKISLSENRFIFKFEDKEKCYL